MGIGAVLTQALCFIGIILLGNVLRQLGFFREEDFPVLSKIVLKISLPAAIVSSFANKEVSAGMLGLSLLGFLSGALYILLAFLMSAGRDRESRAFAAMNLPGYNIGNFTLPFVQGFLGPAGVIATSLFDAGNAVICLGASYSMASFALNGEGRFSVRELFRKLLRSLPFDVYLLMIGVGFHLSGSREQTAAIVRVIAVRYGTALLLAIGFCYLLPFAQEVRQTLCILVFAPLGSAAPAFTSELGLDVGLASAINSISIVVSICCIVGALLVVL